jgi:DsbC/DsbD-like thiol-disulfide interchange protein
MRWRTSSPRFFPALAIGIALLLCATGTRAAGAPIQHGALELIAESQWIAPGHPFYLGLHFQLEKGWHIYWVNPGDSGEPPGVTWQLPAGFTPGPTEWPTPRRLSHSTIADFGYEDAVMLIVPMHAPTNLAVREPARLGAEVKVLICREICVPGKVQLTLTLPVKSGPPLADPQTRGLFAAARKSLPRPAPANWKLSVNEAKDSFDLTVILGRQITQATFFPLAESQIQNAAPQTLVPLAAGFRLTLRKSDQFLKPVERLKGVLVLTAGHAYLIDAPVAKAGAVRSNNGIGIHTVPFFQEEIKR